MLELFYCLQRRPLIVITDYVIKLSLSKLFVPIHLIQGNPKQLPLFNLMAGYLKSQRSKVIAIKWSLCIRIIHIYLFNTSFFFLGRMLRVVWFGLFGLFSFPPNKNWRLSDHDKFIHPKLNTPAIPKVRDLELIIPDVDNSYTFHEDSNTRIGHRPYYEFTLHKRTPCEMVCSFCGNQRWQNMCIHSNCDRNSRAFQVCMARKNARK